MQPNNDVQTIGSKIKELRMQKGMTLQEPADKVYLNKSTLKRYEDGEIIAKRKILEALAKELGVSIQYLLNEEENGGETMQTTLFKRRRKELGLTLLDIAKYVGVTEATVQRWESGNIKNVRHEKVALLSQILQTSPAVIMGWEQDQNDNENGGETMSNENNSTEKYTAADKKKILDALKLIRQECIDAEECKRCAFWVSRGCRFKLERNPSDWELIDDECAWRAFREPTRRPEGACFLNKD